MMGSWDHGMMGESLAHTTSRVAIKGSSSNRALLTLATTELQHGTTTGKPRGSCAPS